jgi:hypothetical protein
MALKQEVKTYLAYWFQLGKSVVKGNGMATLLPRNIFAGNGYSQEFEECWQEIIASPLADYYLEGTHQTIAELLKPEWELSACAKCEMPVPVRNIGMPPLVCPCHDLQNWPNTELPQPREPVNSELQLKNICDRLVKD